MNKSPWFSIKAGGGIGEIAIFDEIGSGDATAKRFIEQLKSAGTLSAIRLTINSPGGDTADGFAILDCLARQAVPITIEIQGLAASMASAIAMVPGATVVMAENAFLMIHNPWGATSGNADAIQSFGEAVRKMQMKLVRIYAERTGLSEKTIQEMMDKETWLDAAEAVELGFADDVIPAMKVAAHVGKLSIARMPQQMRWAALHREAFAQFNGKREVRT